MKTLLFSVIIFLFISPLYSQPTGACGIDNFTVTLISSQPGANGKCNVVINLSWEATLNNGSKFMYLHLWEASRYQSFTYQNPSHQNAPKASDLSDAIGTVIIKNPASANAAFSFTYNPDPGYHALLPSSASITTSLHVKNLSNSKKRFEIRNLYLANLECQPGEIYSLKGDVWVSQQQKGKNVHCFKKDMGISINEIVSRSLVLCNSSNGVQVKIWSKTAGAVGTYQLFVDSNNDEQFDALVDLPLNSPAPFSTGSATVSSGLWPYEFIAPSVLVPTPFASSNFWLVISNSNGTKQVFPVVNTCSVLPVTLESFEAVNTGSGVDISWSAASEENIKLYTLQKQNGRRWKRFASISPKNSGSTERYTFKDLQILQGKVQYQLRAHLNDGKTIASKIVLVQGAKEDIAFDLYPNPSANGVVTLGFKNNNARDIWITDASGSVIKKYGRYRQTSLKLEQLPPALYLINVFDRKTRESNIEKLIVQ